MRFFAPRKVKRHRLIFRCYIEAVNPQIYFLISVLYIVQCTVCVYDFEPIPCTVMVTSYPQRELGIHIGVQIPNLIFLLNSNFYPWVFFSPELAISVLGIAAAKFARGFEHLLRREGTFVHPKE